MPDPDLPNLAGCQCLAEVFEHYGIELNDQIVEQFHVLMQALAIHHSRSVYRDGWRKYGALGTLVSIARKADRLMQVFWFGSGDLTHKDSTDDAMDLINYAAFFIRNVRDGNVRGRNS